MYYFVAGVHLCQLLLPLSVIFWSSKLLWILASNSQVKDIFNLLYDNNSIITLTDFTHKNYEIICYQIVEKSDPENLTHGVLQTIIVEIYYIKNSENILEEKSA